jgi:uncharacterized protein (TIGR00369 family)
MSVATPMLRERYPVTRAAGCQGGSFTSDERGESEREPHARLLRGSPFAVEAGFQAVFAEEEHAVVTLPVHRGVGTDQGKAHPGAITALVEAAGALAADQRPDEQDASLAGITITFVRPSSERPLVAEARVLGGEGGLRSCEVEVRDWDGALVAKGFLTYGLGKENGRT